MSDARVTNMGSIYTVGLLTNKARLWVDENVDPEAQFFGDELVVEHSYIYDLVEAMVADDLEVV